MIAAELLRNSRWLTIFTCRSVARRSAVSYSLTGTAHEDPGVELIPLRRRRRFVARDEFAGRSRNAAALDLDAFRADQDAAIDQETAGPHQVRPDTDQNTYAEHAERARRLDTNLLTIVPVGRPNVPHERR